MINPWQYIWAPHLKFPTPFSGSVKQDIHPASNWFYSLIDQSAGDPQIEKKIFEHASYGRQIGRITDALIELTETLAKLDSELKEADSFKKLKTLSEEIQKIKVSESERSEEIIKEQLRHLKLRDPEKFNKLKKEIEHLY